MRFTMREIRISLTRVAVTAAVGVALAGPVASADSKEFPLRKIELQLPPCGDQLAFNFQNKVDAQDVLDKPESKALQTKDGWTIQITYFKSKEGKNAPVIVLLHMKESNRFVWEGQGGMAEVFQRHGYAVITVDLRHHGESRAAGGAAGIVKQGADKKKGSGKKGATLELKPVEYLAMIQQDLEAVKSFIYKENQEEHLNMARMGIVGPEMGASIAAAFAAADWLKAPHPDGPEGRQTRRGQDVRAIVLISPQSTWHGLSVANSMKDLKDPKKGIALLVCVGKDDTQDKGQAKKIFDQAFSFPGSDERMYFYDYKAKLRGTSLLGNKLGIEDHLLVFFNEHLKKLEIQWSDRQSKLGK